MCISLQLCWGCWPPDALVGYRQVKVVVLRKLLRKEASSSWVPANLRGCKAFVKQTAVHVPSSSLISHSLCSSHAVLFRKYHFNPSLLRHHYHLTYCGNPLVPGHLQGASTFSRSYWERSSHFLKHQKHFAGLPAAPSSLFVAFLRPVRLQRLAERRLGISLSVPSLL